MSLKKLSRLRLKGDDTNPDTQFKGLLPQCFKNGAMPKMNTVKIPYGRDTGPVLWSDVVQSADQLHWGGLFSFRLANDRLYPSWSNGHRGICFNGA